MFEPSPLPYVPTLLERLKLRAQVDRSIRAVLDGLGMLEIHVPSIVPVPGMEDHLDAFQIRSPTRKLWEPRWLHTSPEFAIKERFGEIGCDVYCMARVYRDEPSGLHHSPEFTMLEWYRRDSDYTALMSDVEEIIRTVVVDVLGTDCPNLAGSRGTFDLRGSWRRISWEDAFSPYVPDPLRAEAAAWATALRAAGIEVDPEWDIETLSSMLWAEVIEPSFDREPIFLIEFPASQAALARLSAHNPEVAERFEVYLPGPWARSPGWGGIEIANAFSELIDPEDQRRRFEVCLERRRAASLPVFPMPEDLLKGLETMPVTAGIALGVDRLTTWVAQALLGWQVEVSDFFCTARGGQ